MRVSSTDDAAGNCPDLPWLYALAVGDPLCPDLDEILVHVSHCECCRILLATLEDEDGCDEDSHDSEIVPAQFVHEAGYRNLIQRLSLMEVEQGQLAAELPAASGQLQSGTDRSVPGDLTTRFLQFASHAARLVRSGPALVTTRTYRRMAIYGLGLAFVIVVLRLVLDSSSGFRTLPYGFQGDLFPLDANVVSKFNKETRTLELADQVIIGVPFNWLPRGENYTIEVSLRPKGKVRRFGVFWGSGLTRHHGHETRTQHILAINPNRSDRSRNWVFTHSELLFATDPQGIASVTDFPPFHEEASIHVADPLAWHHVQLRVLQGRVVHVIWDGQTQFDWETASNQGTAAAPGACGVFANGGAAEFKDFQIKDFQIADLSQS